jgi:hypothetical protein
LERGVRTQGGKVVFLGRTGSVGIKLRVDVNAVGFLSKDIKLRGDVNAVGFLSKGRTMANRG